MFLETINVWRTGRALIKQSCGLFLASTRSKLCLRGHLSAQHKKEAHPKGRLRKFCKTRLTFGELKRLNRIRTFSSFCAGFWLNKAIFIKVQITSFLLKKRICCLFDTCNKLSLPTLHRTGKRTVIAVPSSGLLSSSIFAL